MLVEERAGIFHIPTRPDLKIHAALVCVFLDRLQSAQKRFLFLLLCGAAPAELGVAVGAGVVAAARKQSGARVMFLMEYAAQLRIKNNEVEVAY